MLGRGGRTEWLAAKSTGAVPLADVVANSVTTTADVNATATLITWDKGRDVNVLLWNYHDADVPAPPAEIHLTIDGNWCLRIIISTSTPKSSGEPSTSITRPTGGRVGVGQLVISTSTTRPSRSSYALLAGKELDEGEFNTEGGEGFNPRIVPTT